MKFILITFATLCLTGIFGFSIKKEETKVIVLDPRYAFIEKRSAEDFAFEILENAKNRLEQEGYTVLMTTDKLTAASLEKRMQFAKQHNADLYVTLSFQNVELLKHGGKNKAIKENYMIYPVVGKNVAGEKSPGTNTFYKAKELASKLQSGLKNAREVQARVFSNAFVYDIPNYGFHLSVHYQPGTPFYQTLSSKEYQDTITEILVSYIRQGL